MTERKSRWRQSLCDAEVTSLSCLQPTNGFSVSSTKASVICAGMTNGLFDRSCRLVGMNKNSYISIASGFFYRWVMFWRCDRLSRRDHKSPYGIGSACRYPGSPIVSLGKISASRCWRYGRKTLRDDFGIAATVIANLTEQFFTGYLTQRQKDLTLRGSPGKLSAAISFMLIFAADNSSLGARPTTSSTR